MANVTIHLTHATLPELTFDVPPEWNPTFAPVVNEEDGIMEGIRETWTIEAGVFTNSVQDDLVTEWIAAKNYAHDKLSPSAAQMKVGGDIKHKMDAAEGFKWLAISEISTDAEPGSFSTWVSMRIVITGLKPLTDGAGIVGWEQELSFSYGTDGFLVKEQSTSIRTFGVSAVGKASSYALTKPAAAVWLTNGPNGVDTTQNKDDTAATFRSAYREIGITLPSGTNDVSQQDSTRLDGELSLISKTVSAQGNGAETWVKAQKPTRALTEEIVQDPVTKRWSGRWTERGTPSQAEDVEHNYTERTIRTRGGGRSTSFQSFNGEDLLELPGDPVPMFIIEQVVVSRVGEWPQLPTLIWADNYVGPQSEDGWGPIKRGVAPEGDIIQIGATRVYRFPGTDVPELEEVRKAIRDIAFQRKEDPDWVDRVLQRGEQKDDSSVQHGAKT